MDRSRGGGPGSRRALSGPPTAQHQTRRTAAALAAVALVASTGLGQTPDYQPRIGQTGKDVIWVPTSEALVDRMLAMGDVGPGDVLFDLGSGDGRTVIAAAKRGAKAVGVEYNPDLVALSRRRAEREGLSRDQARFIHGDIFETDFSDATVVTLYLLTDLNLRLRPTLLEMPPGTRVVSNMFGMGEWRPDETSQLGVATAYLWVVPARVEGDWRLALGEGRSFDLEIDQTFQRIEGVAHVEPVVAGLREAWLWGAKIGFAFVDAYAVPYELTGSVSGDRMQGTYRSGAHEGEWTATRR